MGACHLPTRMHREHRVTYVHRPYTDFRKHGSNRGPTSHIIPRNKFLHFTASSLSKFSYKEGSQRVACVSLLVIDLDCDSLVDKGLVILIMLLGV